MSMVTVGRQNGADIDIYYEDHGEGRPVVLIHGYPLGAFSWERQEIALLDAGYRVITYDRRGFGRSSRPTVGYDYDTFTADLHTLIEHLDLTGITLTGFAMGTGEVARYLGTHGSARVSRAVLIAAMLPCLAGTGDGPGGQDLLDFDCMKAAIREDRYAYLEEFLNSSYNMEVLGGERMSDQAWHASFVGGLAASAFATYACVDAWRTDFRPDLRKFDVPTLVVHGTDDRILPIDGTAATLPALLRDVTFVPVRGGPHNIAWTHPDEVNRLLLDFLAG